jgi:uncharacterized phage protein gp47/JayE
VYEDQDDLTIKNRMANNITSDIDKSEGSFINDVLSPTSKEIAQNYIDLDELLKRVFAITAAQYGYSTELENKCAEFGVTRKVGSYSTGQITFSGTEGTVIPNGTLVQTLSGLQFRTLQDGVISNGSLTTNIQAVELGSNYNVPANTINQLPVQLVGITSVTNKLTTSGGSGAESDNDLLQRLLLKARTPAVSGNANHYKAWATEVSGIGDAKIFPLWNGPGTVKVCVIDSNKQPANADLINTVSEHIEENRPIGASVTVESAQALNINIITTVVASSNYTIVQLQENIKSKIQSYLQAVAFKQNYLSYAQIGSCILSSDGISDYSTLSINGGASNVNIGTEQVAVVGTVTVNE